MSGLAEEKLRAREQWGQDPCGAEMAREHVDDFSKLATELILRQAEGIQIEELCGPEDLTASELANRISRHYSALPLPLWWPLALVGLKTLHLLGVSIVKPDQLTRLSGRKTATAESSKTNGADLRRFLHE